MSVKSLSKSGEIIANPKLKNGKSFTDLSELLEKYTELSDLKKLALLMEISAFIGIDNEDMQKRAEHNAKIYFDSTPLKVQ